MSEHILEIRYLYHNDDTQTTMYRIGTRDWVDIKDLTITHTFQNDEGEYETKEMSIYDTTGKLIGGGEQ